MRPAVTTLALALVLLSAASPAIEAVAGCLELCQDENPGQSQCSTDACCSCCVHAGPLFASLPVPEPTLELIGATIPADPRAARSGRTFDILHVPKLSAS
jgi:hypothetical protein